MKYLVIGIGGVGGSIAGFLSLGGKDVACIARGEHLKALQTNGLHLKSDLKGEHHLHLPTYATETYNEKADVIFVCVKAYSLNPIIPFIERVSHSKTIVIPILNGFAIGSHLQQILPTVTILEGCIYIVSERTGLGEISQQGSIFRLVYGVPPGSHCPIEPLEAIKEDLTNCGIKVDLSDHIRRDTFIKWAFISAAAVTGAYYDVPMRELQNQGHQRDTFIRLSEEIQALAGQMNIILPEDQVSYNLKVLDKMLPESRSSMQRDLICGGNSELQAILFDVLRFAEDHQIDLPTYRLMANHFQNVVQTSNHNQQ